MARQPAHVRLNISWIHSDYEQLSSHAAKLLVLLLCYRDKDTGECYPAQATLCKAMKMSRWTLREVMNELEDAGYVGTVHKTANDEQGRIKTRNRYYVHV